MLLLMTTISRVIAKTWQQLGLLAQKLQASKISDSSSGQCVIMRAVAVIALCLCVLTLVAASERTTRAEKL